MEGGGNLDLEIARAHFAQRSWTRAFDALTAADAVATLGPDDLERLATAAYLIGRVDDHFDALDRAHHAYLRSGQTLRGIRCAVWLGLGLMLRGAEGRATGWFARAERLAQCHDCADRGYLLLPVAEQCLNAGDLSRAHAAATAGVAVAERFDDVDLLACARHLQGSVLLQGGEIARGLACLDEVMLLVTAGRLSPIVTGLMYCSVIDACQAVCAAGRAREWTLALSDWCDAQPEMAAFTGVCLAHRAQIMRLHGAWDTALAEARRACERGARAGNRRAASIACYEAGEIHRLRGEFAAAEEAYRNASRWGAEPQPGLALLRLAQGRTGVAAATIQRVAGIAASDSERIKILPAYVEIMLAAGDIAAAQSACDELERTAARFQADVVSAFAAHARGEIDLAEGEPSAALASLRRARELWHALDAPYHSAKARVSSGLACRALDDEDGLMLELDAARAVFERLAASPDLAQLDTIARQTPAGRRAVHRLTRRELEVLRLVATGQTNKQIAAELELSDKTIDRHVSNILAKLSVPSRAAATAYAYRNRLV